MTLASLTRYTDDPVVFALGMIIGWFIIGRPLYRTLRNGGWNAIFAGVVSLSITAAIMAWVSFSDHIRHALYSPTGDFGWKK